MSKKSGFRPGTKAPNSGQYQQIGPRGGKRVATTLVLKYNISSGRTFESALCRPDWVFLVPLRGPSRDRSLPSRPSCRSEASPANLRCGAQAETAILVTSKKR